MEVVSEIATYDLTRSTFALRQACSCKTQSMSVKAASPLRIQRLKKNDLMFITLLKLCALRDRA